ncbi:pyridoxamine 5'-phosphate oxidase [Oligoflexia bacterium]|nr:pyridoxamine 5'-phosphate oxidase [Oligoflexia bacterium]
MLKRKFSSFREVFFFLSRPYLWLRSPIRLAELNRNPFEQFRLWFEHAQRSLWMEFPHATCLSTVDQAGYPDGRMVLLKGFDESGFVFYTNAESTKGRSLQVLPKAALTFYWGAMQRQVRIQGQTVQVSAEEADQYFDTRPRGSQIGAWASSQSAALNNRAELEEQFEKIRLKFKGAHVPRPANWVGYRVMPEAFEFWQLRLSRLHDRFRYEKSSAGVWEVKRLAP